MTVGTCLAEPPAPVVLPTRARPAIEAAIAAERMRPADQFDSPPRLDAGHRVVIMTITGAILPWQFADMVEWWRAVAYRLVTPYTYWFTCDGCGELGACDEDSELCDDCSLYPDDGE